MELASWRNVAIIWLSLFCLIGLVPPIVIGYFAVRGLGLAPGKLRPLLHKAQGYSSTLRQQTETASLRISEPVLQLRRRATSIHTTLHRILPARKQAKIRK